MATAALLRDPRAVKLSNQLRGQAAALAKRNITTLNPDYIDRVADAMVSLGWLDLTGIKATKESATGQRKVYVGTEGEFYIEDVEFERLAWTYNGAPMFALQSPDPEIDPLAAFGDAVPVYEDDDFRVLIEWLDPPGAPIVYMRRVYRANIWRGVAFVAGFAAMAAGLPQIIGKAVLGAEVAAAYPAFSNAVGTVATRTVLTGGDVESAVRSAATVFGGVVFGGFVGEAVDSAAIGAAAGAATAAALQGGDARAAAVQALISQGVKSVSDFDPTEYDPGEYVYLPGYGDDGPPIPGLDYRFVSGGEITLDDLGLSFDLDEVLANLEMPEALTLPLDAIIPDDDGNLFGVDGFYVELSDRGYIGAIYPDEQGNIRAPDNNILMPADEVIKYLESPAELAEQLRVRIEPLQGEPIAPLTAPNLRPINIPPPAGQTRTPVIDWAKQADALLKVAVSIGGSIKAISSGTFRPPYGTSPYGTARPPIGVPVRQGDGSTVVNNGNGTQTVRYPDGRVVTMPTTYTSTGMAGNYGQTLIPGVPNTALLIGGGLVIAALLLSRR